MSYLSSRSNTAEAYSMYVDPLDVDNVSSVTPTTPQATLIVPVNKTNTNLQYKNKWNMVFPILIVLVFFVFLVGLFTNWFQWSTFSNKLIKKYEHKANSQFTNKDQVDFSDDNNYDINYLVEQMIYKEFSPSDKKKYLNLPAALKDSLVIDYLIEKI